MSPSARQQQWPKVWSRYSNQRRYAEVHGDIFDRIDAVAKIEDKLNALNLRSQTVRGDRQAQNSVVEAVFKKHGGNYS